MEKKMRETSKNSKKKWILLPLCLIIVFVLAGCSSTKLSDAFDKETVKSTAQTAIDYLIAGEYGEVMAMMNETVKEGLTEEALTTNVEAMNELTGAFKEYKSVAVIGQKDSEGTDMAVVVIVAVFENRNVTYTISLNTNMEIVGLWMK